MSDDQQPKRPGFSTRGFPSKSATGSASEAVTRDEALAEAVVQAEAALASATSGENGVSAPEPITRARTLVEAVDCAEDALATATAVTSTPGKQSRKQAARAAQTAPRKDRRVAPARMITGYATVVAVVMGALAAVVIGLIVAFSLGVFDGGKTSSEVTPAQQQAADAQAAEGAALAEDAAGDENTPSIGMQGHKVSPKFCAAMDNLVLSSARYMDEVSEGIAEYHGGVEVPEYLAEAYAGIAAVPSINQVAYAAMAELSFDPTSSDGVKIISDFTNAAHIDETACKMR